MTTNILCYGIALAVSGFVLAGSVTACGGDDPDNREPLRLVDVMEDPLVDLCPNGGYITRTGYDRDFDGVLDDEEVELTDYGCHGVLRDEPRIKTPEDVAALDGIIEVTGCIEIGFSELETVELPTLERVGCLRVRRNPMLKSVMLPRLKTVTGGILVEDIVEVIEVPELESVGGDLMLLGSEQFRQYETLTLPRLSSIGKSLVMRTLGPRTGTFPELRHVGSDVDLSGNPALDRISLPELELVGGSLILMFGLETLAELSLPRLREISAIEIRLPATLASLKLPALQRITKLEIDTFFHRARASLSFPELVEVGDRLDIGPSASILLPRLATVGYRASMNAAALDLGELTSVGHSLIVGGVGTASDSFELPKLQSVGENLLLSVGAGALSLPALTQVGMLRLADSPNLEVVSAPALSDVRTIEIRDNPALRELSLIGNGQPQSALSSITIAANDSLQRIYIDGWAAIEGQLHVYFNRALVEIDARFTSMGKAAFVTNSSLNAVLLDQLMTGGEVTIVSNQALQDLSMDSIENLDKLSVSWSSQLSACIIDEIVARLPPGTELEIRDTIPCTARDRVDPAVDIVMAE